MAATYGQKTVRVNFNASGDSEIDRVKATYAELIDQVMKLWSDKAKNTESNDDVDKYVSDDRDNRILERLAVKTISALEDAASLHVKMITAP